MAILLHIIIKTEFIVLKFALKKPKLLKKRNFKVSTVFLQNFLKVGCFVCVME